jgi:hypothetical protein
MKLTLLRDAGLVCITIGVVLKVFEQPVVGDPYAFSRAAWRAAGCGIAALLLWVTLSLIAEALRERKEQTRRGVDVPPPSCRPPTDE